MNTVICSKCGYSRNFENGLFCGNCGTSMSHVRVLDSGNYSSTSLQTSRVETQVTMWSGDLEYGSKLALLEEKYSRALEARHKGGLRWELIGRHIEAYEIQQELDQLEKSIRQSWGRAVAEVEAQKAQAVIDFHQRQIQYEFDLRDQQHQQELQRVEQEFAEIVKQAELRGKIDRWIDALTYLDERIDSSDLLEGLDPEIKRQIIMRLVNKIELEVFGSAENEGIPVILE